MVCPVTSGSKLAVANELADVVDFWPCGIFGHFVFGVSNPKPMGVVAPEKVGYLGEEMRALDKQLADKLLLLDGTLDFPSSQVAA